MCGPITFSEHYQLIKYQPGNWCKRLADPLTKVSFSNKSLKCLFRCFLSVHRIHLHQRRRRRVRHPTSLIQDVHALFHHSDVTPARIHLHRGQDPAVVLHVVGRGIQNLEPPRSVFGVGKFRSETCLPVEPVGRAGSDQDRHSCCLGRRGRKGYGLGSQLCLTIALEYII